MKFELTKRQQAALDHAVKSNPLHKYLLNKDNVNFEIGDVLIKKTKNYQKSWRYETVSSSNQMPQRYVFVFKDEFGIGYVKQLRVSDGKLGDEIYCLADYDYEYARFEVDPEYAEKVFLDANFDIKEIHRASLEARKLIAKSNRKIGVKFKTLKVGNDFFSKLKVGNTFWTSYDYTCKHLKEYEVVSINKVMTTTLNQASNWGWDALRRNFPEFINDDHTYIIKTKDVSSNFNGYEREHHVYDFYRDDILYTVKPAQEKN